MSIIYLIIGGLIFLAIFSLLSSAFEVPNFKVYQTIQKIGKEKKVESRFLENIILSISEWIVPFIKLNPYKKSKMQAVFVSLGINKRPEELHAEGLAKAFLTALLALALFFVIPLIGVALIVLAILFYFQTVRKPYDELEKRKGSIERELPRFCSNIEQELKTDRGDKGGSVNVLTILENYQKNAGFALAHELNITIADMKSSNYESALVRMESRINSGMLSSIISGLISIDRGDDALFYFSNLTDELNEIEINLLEMEVKRRPSKIRKYMVLIMVAFMGGFFVIIGYQILTLLPKLFI